MHFKTSQTLSTGHLMTDTNKIRFSLQRFKEKDSLDPFQAHSKAGDSAQTLSSSLSFSGYPPPSESGAQMN